MVRTRIVLHLRTILTIGILPFGEGRRVIASRTTSAGPFDDTRNGSMTENAPGKFHDLQQGGWTGDF